MDEKRRKPRIRANVVVNFKVKTTRLVGGARIKDISETGLCIPSKHHFTLGAEVELEIRSDELTEPIKIMSKVVRITNRNKSKYPFEVGIQFTDIPITKQRIFEEYINRAIAQGIQQDISWMD